MVFGQVGGSILLLCRNVSKEATEVVWFQGDPHAFPPLFSSRVSFPPDIRFSLVDNSSLSITELRVQDEGNYTCREVLNKTDHEHRVQLLVASKSSPQLSFFPSAFHTPKFICCWWKKIVFRKCKRLYRAESLSHPLMSTKMCVTDLAYQGKCQLSSPCCVCSSLLVINEFLDTSSIPCSYSRGTLCLRIWLTSVSMNLGVEAAACCLLSLVWDRCAVPFLGAVLLVGELFPAGESCIDGSTKFLSFMSEQCPKSVHVISTGYFFQLFCAFWCCLPFPSLFHPFIP